MIPSNIYDVEDSQNKTLELTDFRLQLVGLHYKLSEGYSMHGTPIPLNLIDGSRDLLDSKTSSTFGVVDQRDKKILEVLGKEMILQLFADYLPTRSGQASKDSLESGTSAKRSKHNQTLGLFVVLYGSPTLSEAVATYTAKCHLFLQHPENCDRNVRYQNPQCLFSGHGKTVYTLEMENRTDASNFDLVIPTNPIDFFADASIQDVLAYAATPSSLSTELYTHQKQALTFMMQRERGWAIDGHHKDIWKVEQDLHHGTIYRNMISGLKYTRPPRQFKGGLLIDAPGLGKSLSILALIASDVQNPEPVKTGTTLLIVPKTCEQYFAIPQRWGSGSNWVHPVIEMWKEELQKWETPV